MVMCPLPLLAQSIFAPPNVPDFHCFCPLETAQKIRRKSKRNGALILTMAATNAAKSEVGDIKPTKLVTFLGKGGSGKTTAAIFAAQVCI
ncbi:hypothetical protein CDL12_26482 [Handroanthus impetiginosus]|uniref:Anion-transporting ATPase-like domain-containing protein n=1 Tax=Handroanthus impetiginosus TaxID=429701 RepID=A0A2G9G6S8_9LAMI|nr:hypothetical protein CDL12_26482 [Handroanthus impetiginosus]